MPLDRLKTDLDRCLSSFSALLAVGLRGSVRQTDTLYIYTPFLLIYIVCGSGLSSLSKTAANVDIPTFTARQTLCLTLSSLSSFLHGFITLQTALRLLPQRLAACSPSKRLKCDGTVNSPKTHKPISRGRRTA